MHFVKQTCSLPILNLDTEKQIQGRHGKLLPDNIRCIIAGPSGTGKSNIVLSLLLQPNALRFENVYLYSKSLNQPKYQLLREVLRRVPEVGFFPFAENAELIPYAEAKPNSILILDDISCDNQDRIREYFSISRHKDICCFYLCQSYSRVPKAMIRDNTNLLVLFRQDDTNLRHVYDEHVGTGDMTFTQFKDFCSQCWKEDYGFAVVDKTNKIGRYRKGFDEFLKWYK